jgi:hypothetical protein
VPKYDAFGREIGEETLGGLGSGATADATPDSEVAEDSFAGLGSGATAEPAPAQPEPTPLRAEQPVFTATPQPQPQPRSQRPSVTIPLRPQRRRRSGRGVIFVVLFILFIFIAPLVIGAVAIFSTVDDATEAVRGGIKDGLESVPSTPAKPAGAPPKGIGGRSLVRRGNLAAALGKLRSSELRLTHLRLAPERIDAQLLTRGGRLRSVQVQPGGAIERLGPDSGPGFDQSSTIPFGRVNPGAPQRLARRGAAKLGVPVSTLQYLVPTNFGGKVTWAAYFKRARYVIGDAAGRYQKSYP